MVMSKNNIGSSSPIEKHDRHEDWRYLASIVWLSLLGVFVASIQPIFLGALAEAYSFDAQQLGLIGGAEMGGVTLASIVAIYWYPRFKLRKIALCGLICAVVGNALTSLVSDFSMLLALRFGIGFFGSGVIYSMSLGLIGQTRNPDRMIAFAVMLQVIALSIAMIVLPELISRWQIPGIMLAITVLISTGLIVLPLLPERSIQGNTIETSDAGDTFGKLLPAGFLVTLVFFSMALGGAWAFMERAGVHAGISGLEVGKAFALGSLVGGLGALLAIVINKRFGRALPLLASLMGMIGACLVLTVAKGWGSFLVTVCLFNFFWNLTLPYLLGAIAEADRSGKFMVVIPAAQGIGFAAGPVLTGWFILENSYAITGWISLVLFMVCLLLLLPLLLALHSLSNQGSLPCKLAKIDSEKAKSAMADKVKNA